MMVEGQKARETAAFKDSVEEWELGLIIYPLRSPSLNELHEVGVSRGGDWLDAPPAGRVQGFTSLAVPRRALITC